MDLHHDEPNPQRHLRLAPSRRGRDAQSPDIAVVFHDVYGPDAASNTSSGTSPVNAGGSIAEQARLGIAECARTARDMIGTIEVAAPPALWAPHGHAAPTRDIGRIVHVADGSDSHEPTLIPAERMRAAVRHTTADLLLFVDAHHLPTAEQLGTILAAWSTGVETDVIYTRPERGFSSRMVRWLVGLDGQRLDLTLALFTRTAAETIIGASRLSGHTVDVELAYLAEDLGFAVSFIVPPGDPALPAGSRQSPRPRLRDVLTLRLRGSKLSGTTAQQVVVSDQTTRLRHRSRAA